MLVYVRVLFDILCDRVALARAEGERDRGASALEWAIIAAISVIIASIIGAVVYNVVSDKGQSIQDCASKANGTAQC